MSRTLAAVVSLALVGATLEPLARSPLDDGFPLSTYPMFAVPRERAITLSYAYGVTAGGERRTLSPDDVGSREVLQAFATLQRAAAEGPAEAQRLCDTIAQRVRGGDVIAVRIVTATFDALAYFTDARTSGEGELEHARCEVPR